ncbi:DoxX family protein [Paenibacillus alkalitolerans]|uniref:DoxX family protein n=1 Tax=Paenibacillus alkalitolerans TaxID=2799335 RepID=UPI0018F45F8E|nr:DoxX family protein [Paenibacillus alkalitolerans]
MIAYWSVTLLLAAAVMMSGIGQLMQYGGNLELVTNLGFPLYVLTILGIWKVLGAIAHAALNIASWALRPKSRKL